MSGHGHEEGRGRSAEEIARLVEADPGNPDLLRALDALAPLGLDPESPTTGPFRGGGATRTTALGAGVGLIETRARFRTTLVPNDDGDVDVAVNAAGHLLLATREGSGAPIVRELDLGGQVCPTSPELAGVTPYLAAGWTIAVDRRRRTIHAVDTRGRRSSCEFETFAVIGCGHAFTFGPGNGGVVIEARALGSLPVVRWRHAVEGQINWTSDLAVAPGACLGIVTWVARSTPGLAIGLLARVDVATGERTETVSLPVMPGAQTAIFPSGSGVTYLGLARRVVAVREGRLVWSAERGTLSVLGLAGSDGAVLLGRSIEDRGLRALHGLDPEDGRPLWSTRPQPWIGPPQIDGTGRIFARLGDDLVVLDPATGQEQYRTAIGGPGDAWGFAIAGSGRTVVARLLPSSGEGEVVVLR